MREQDSRTGMLLGEEGVEAGLHAAADLVEFLVGVSYEATREKKK